MCWESCSFYNEVMSTVLQIFVRLRSTVPTWLIHDWLIRMTIFFTIHLHCLFLPFFFYALFYVIRLCARYLFTFLHFIFDRVEPPVSMWIFRQQFLFLAWPWMLSSHSWLCCKLFRVTRPRSTGKILVISIIYYFPPSNLCWILFNVDLLITETNYLGGTKRMSTV